MGIIRQLPTAVINQIAAGEVVERPASVVKELLENAVDAGATRIDLSVERGGKDLIRVADNGKGMSPDDLVPAFQPHATSKLADADDLFRIRTLGFRGEALAAIAEVAKVRCQTRQADATDGSDLTIEGGIFGPVKNCGCPPGTVIEVRNLFYHIPVRRTFLKSDMTESGHVVEMFSRIALRIPKCTSPIDRGARSFTTCRRSRARASGSQPFSAASWPRACSGSRAASDEMHLWGYVAHPSQSRSSAKGQFLFLGGRYVRDRSLSSRAQRSVSRAVDGRPHARGVSPPRCPRRGGRRQRPSDQGRGPISRLAESLQPSVVDVAADFLAERPARKTAGGAGAIDVRRGGAGRRVAGVGPVRPGRDRRRDGGRLRAWLRHGSVRPGRWAE